MKSKGFVALDFEHLFPAHETVCEVGAVRVVDGLVTGRFYSLIRPAKKFCAGRSNSDIIGLTLDMVATAPEFPDVYAQLRAFCGNLPLVAHHSTTETAVLSKCCELYGIKELLGNGDLYDTYDYTRKSLVDSCAERSIPLPDHHNPLADAEATARLFLSLVGTKPVEVVRGERTFLLATYREEQSTFDHTILQPLSDDEVERKDTPFFGGVKVVVSGNFPHFPDRNALKAALKDLGADVDTAVSSRTAILVAGSSAVGPSKWRKATEYGTRVMREDELLRYVDPQI